MKWESHIIPILGYLSICIIHLTAGFGNKNLMPLVTQLYNDQRYSVNKSGHSTFRILKCKKLYFAS